VPRGTPGLVAGAAKELSSSTLIPCKARPARSRVPMSPMSLSGDRRRRTGHHEARKHSHAGKPVSPSRRRSAVFMLEDRRGLSERRACQIAGQHRSTQRRALVLAEDDGAQRARLRGLSRERPRWGYRRAHADLLAESWGINRKRVQRVWREEGLRVPKRRRKRRRFGSSTVPA
jgi:transposase